jgi:hypothetical protein
LHTSSVFFPWYFIITNLCTTTVGPILRWYRGRVELIRGGANDENDVSGHIRLAVDVILSLIGSALDYARALFQIASELLRNCVWLRLTGGGGGGGGDNGMNNNTNVFNGVVRLCSHRDRDILNNDTRRRNGGVGTTARNRNRCNSLPELEDCLSPAVAAVDPSFGSEHYDFGLLDESNGRLKETTRIAEQTSLTNQQQRGAVWDWGSMLRAELEPAFLDENDYPADWIVYHPVLRVVTKKEADKYDRERIQQLRLGQQHRNSDSRPATISTSPGVDVDQIEEKNNDLIGGVESLKNGEDRAVLEFPVGDNNNTTTKQPPNGKRQQENHNKASPSDSMPVLRSVDPT